MPETLLHYDLLGRLGEGARSTIYKARDQRSGTVVALKHVVRRDPKDLRFVEQMEAEHAVSKHFSHPNLRRSFDLKVQKTMLLKVTEAFLTLEYFEADPLDVRPPPDLYSTLDVFTQAAQGLKALHNMGYVHCDIKPNNILRARDGHVKVIDFGQTVKADTVKERIQGTPDFIAPEQVDRKPVTIQTDVFNLGATLYWALTGKHIPTLYTVKKKGDNALLSDELMDPPSKLNPLVPPQVNELVMACVATHPRKRPGDMDTIIHKLEIGKHLIEKARGTLAVGKADVELDDDQSQPVTTRR